MHVKRTYAAIITLMVLLVSTSASARDWQWTNSYREFSSGEVHFRASPAIQRYTNAGTGYVYGRWQYATAPEGLSIWISDHCRRFISQMRIGAHHSIGECVIAHHAVNQRDPNIIQINERWLLADLGQNPAIVLSRITAGLTEVRLAENPARRALTLAEARQLLDELSNELLLGSATQTMVANQVRRQLEEQSSALPLSADVVRRAVAGVLLEQGHSLGLVTMTAFSNAMAAVERRTADFESRLTRLERDMSIRDNRLTVIEEGTSDALRGFRNNLATVQAELSGGGENRLLRQSDLARLNQFPSSFKSWRWILIVIALVLLVGLVTLIVYLVRWRKNLATVKSTSEEAATTAASAEKTAVEAIYLATDAKEHATQSHIMACKAWLEARVATNLGLPDEWYLIGDLPTPADLDALSEGQSITLSFRHETQGDRQAIFTMAKKSLKGRDGNMMNGLLVAGITGLVKPIAVSPNNMVGKVRSGILSNNFVGVDHNGKTAAPETAAA